MLAPQLAHAQADSSKKLVVSAAQEPPNWDYTVTTATAVASVLAINVIEPLFEQTADGSFKPLLASGYEVSDDGLTYTISLNEATFHDGSTFDANDVLYSFEVNRSSARPELSAPFDAVESIEKLDDRTIRVVLSRSSQAFFPGLAGLAGMILPEGGQDTLAQKPVGTGPYVFANWRPGVSIDVTRFPDYHGQLPFFENVEFRVIGDEIAATNALLAGDVDVINLLVGDGKERADTVAATEGFVVLTRPSNQLNYLAFNQRSEKFADKRVRQAIAHMVNREDIVAGAYAGFAEPICVFVNPKNLPWYSDYCPYPYDPEAALALLEEAGATDLEIDLKYYNISDGPPIYEIVSEHLASIGVKVNNANRELAAYLEEVLGTNPDFEMTPLTGPQTVDSFLCPGWFTNACVPEFDELWKASDVATTYAEAVELRAKAVKVLADEAWVIPTVSWVDVTFASSRLAGWKSFSAMSEVDLRPLHWAE